MLGKSEVNITDRKERVYAQLVGQLLKQTPIGLIATLINAFILVYVLWGPVSPGVLAVWLCAIIIVALLRLGLVYKYRTTLLSIQEAERVGTLSIIAIGVSGMLWGSASVFLFPVDSPLHQTLVVFVLCGMVAGAAGAFSSVFPAFVAFSVPALVPLFIRFLTLGSDAYYAMSAMTCLYLVLTLLIARQISITGKELVEIKEHFADMLMGQTAELRDTNEQLKLQIEERKRAEEASRKSALQWQVTFDAIRDSVCLQDVSGVLQQCNVATLSLLGKSSEEIIGRKCWEVVHGTAEPIEGCPVIRTQKTLKRETLSLPMDGRHFEVIVDPILSEDRQLLGAVHIISDVSERKRTERELAKIQKLESVGILAGGMAHDFNNLLSVIMGYISIVQMSLNPSSESFRALAQAEKACQQSRDLTQLLLTFSEGGAPVKKMESVREIVRGAVDTTLTGTSVRCEFLAKEDLWLASCDSGQLHQALVNLIVNSKEAMHEGGVIQILAKNAVLAEGEVSPLREGSYVKISLKDDGEGISEESLPRIFDPYFSTKQRGTQKGMGLGLTIAYSIVKRHEGHIEADSKPGMGTTFHVYLPACETIAVEPAEHKEEPVVEKVKVLLMDDEEMFRDMAWHMFKHVGCEVELAVGGTEAIRLFAEAQEAGKPFNIVILDLTVRGGMGGKDAIKELLKLDPSLKAVVSTGYSNDPVVLGFREYGFGGVLLKPYGIEQLRRTLQELL